MTAFELHVFKCAVASKDHRADRIVFPAAVVTADLAAAPFGAERGGLSGLAGTAGTPPSGGLFAPAQTLSTSGSVKTYRMRRTAAPLSRLLAALCLLVLLAGPVPAAAEDPSIVVADFVVSPAVLQPGDLGTITATIRNTASTASITTTENLAGADGGTIASTRSTDITVTIERVRLSGGAVEVISGDNARVGALGPGESVPVTFLVRAPAADGVYFPEVWIEVADGRSVRKSVPLNVNTQLALLKKPGLTVEKTVPDSVAPGDDIPVRVDIRNDGLARADQVTVAVNSSSPAIAPRTPGTYHLGTLLRGRNATLEMVFSSDRRAPLGLTPLVLTVTYASADGSIVSQTETVGARLRGRADLGIASLSTDPARIAAGDPVSLVVRLQNTGTDTANSVKASIDLPFSGSADAFVGRIEPNNDAPAVYALVAGDPGTYTYNLSVQFEDDYGVHTQEETLRLTVQDGGSVLPLLAVVVLVLIVAGGAWYLWRKRAGRADVRG